MSEPKVKIIDDAPAPTPSQEIVQAARKTATFTDRRGRRIVIRKLNALHKVDMARLVGSEGMQNPYVSGPCALAFSVTEIDGEPIMPPATYDELRFLIQRLDDDGLEDVADAAVANFDIPMDTATTGDALKNS